MQRLSLAIFLLLICAGTASAKLKEEDQAYLDEHFSKLREQIQALKTRLDTLNAQLTEMHQNQLQLQTVIIRQQRSLQDMDQLLASVRMSGEENFTHLKNELSRLRTDQQKAFSALTGQPGQQPTPGTPEVAAAPRSSGLPVTPPGVQGYITVVSGNDVTVDLGSTQGLRPGARLTVYKANDPNTRVGTLEVTQVLDAGNSRAKIVTMNAGVQPEFSDIVRLE